MWLGGTAVQEQGLGVAAASLRAAVRSRREQRAQDRAQQSPIRKPFGARLPLVRALTGGVEAHEAMPWACPAGCPATQKKEAQPAPSMPAMCPGWQVCRWRAGGLLYCAVACFRQQLTAFLPAHLLALPAQPAGAQLNHQLDQHTEPDGNNCPARQKRHELQGSGRVTCGQSSSKADGSGQRNLPSVTCSAYTQPTPSQMQQPQSD